MAARKSNEHELKKFSMDADNNRRASYLHVVVQRKKLYIMQNFSNRFACPEGILTWPNAMFALGGDSFIVMNMYLGRLVCGHWTPVPDRAFRV